MFLFLKHRFKSRNREYRVQKRAISETRQRKTRGFLPTYHIPTGREGRSISPPGFSVPRFSRTFSDLETPTVFYSTAVFTEPVTEPPSTLYCTLLLLTINTVPSKPNGRGHWPKPTVLF
jgi:hypothetical protein